jgi:hypothetical protein
MREGIGSIENEMENLKATENKTRTVSIFAARRVQVIGY